MYCGNLKEDKHHFGTSAFKYAFKVKRINVFPGHRAKLPMSCAMTWESKWETTTGIQTQKVNKTKRN